MARESKSTASKRDKRKSRDKKMKKGGSHCTGAADFAKNIYGDMNSQARAGENDNHILVKTMSGGGINDLNEPVQKVMKDLFPIDGKSSLPNHTYKVGGSTDPKAILAELMKKGGAVGLPQGSGLDAKAVLADLLKM